jgi:cytochrome P450
MTSSFDLPPGPRGLTATFRMVKAFQAFPPAATREAHQTWGDVVHFAPLGRHTVLVGDPALAGEVMQDKEGVYEKDWVTRGLTILLGHGLLTSEGALWKRQRKLIAPSLTPKQIASYAETMARCAQTWVTRCNAREVRDIHADMTEVTLEIVVETLFGTTLSSGHDSVGSALDRLMSDFQVLVQTWRQFFPRWVPFAARRRMNRTAKELDRILFGLIAKKKEAAATSGVHGDDLLSRLLAARDEEGSGMSDQQLRDECITLFLAGHETTANALSFACLLLAENPAAANTLVAEVRQVLGDRMPGVDDLPRLPYTDAVVRETLRLRPPAHIFGREATKEQTLGNYRIPKGSTVLISPWALHHDARFFPEPDRFRPERWLDGSAKNAPKHAYLPFGGGVRVCIGNHFAMMEAVLVLATMARTFRFERVSNDPVALQAAVTLRPRNGLSLRIHAV